MLSQTTMTAYLDFATDLVFLASDLILPIYAGEFEVEFKEDRSPVTQADRDAETLMRERIHQRYPDHSVLGEEFGCSGPADSSTQWILDPIDGTSSFTRRVPLFGSLVSVVVDGEAVIGVAHFPALGSTAKAARGCGAHLDGRRLRVSSARSLEDSMVCATGFHGTEFDRVKSHTTVDEKRVKIAPLVERAGEFRSWGDCFGHIMVAAGRADAMVDTVMKPWDNAALIPILTEAGARISTVGGRTDDLINAESLVSATPALHSQVIEALQSTEEP